MSTAASENRPITQDCSDLPTKGSFIEGDAVSKKNRKAQQLGAAGPIQTRENREFDGIGDDRHPIVDRELHQIQAAVAQSGHGGYYIGISSVLVILGAIFWEWGRLAFGIEEILTNEHATLFFIVLIVLASAPLWIWFDRQRRANSSTHYPTGNEANGLRSSEASENISGFGRSFLRIGLLTVFLWMLGAVLWMKRRNLSLEDWLKDEWRAGYFITLTVMGLIPILFVAYRWSRKHYNRAVTVAIKTIEGRRFLAVICMVGTVAAISMTVSCPGTRLASEGFLFPVALALLTAAGFLFTLNKLDDILSRIREYSLLVERCAELIEEEIEHAGKSGGRIYICANAVTFGNISAFTKYHRLFDQLKKAFQQPNIEVRILCRDWFPEPDLAKSGIDPWPARGESDDDIQEYEEILGSDPPAIQGLSPTGIRTIKEKIPLGRFYFMWEGIGEWTEEEILKPYCQAVALLNVLRHSSRDNYTAKSVRVFNEGHPPFHVLITSRRAVLFQTLELPNRENSHPPPSVDVIGMETSDTGIVGQLVEAFRFHFRAARDHERIGLGPCSLGDWA